MEQLQNVIVALQELDQDPSTPKHVKARLQSTIKVLNEKSDTSIKVSRALHELEDITDDVNVQSYTRMQIFNIVSLLEIV